jgi:hypothetical protein
LRRDVGETTVLKEVEGGDINAVSFFKVVVIVGVYVD